MRRIISVWLPRWPMDRLRRTACPQALSAAAPEPFALTAASGKGVLLSAVNEAAAAQGLYADMRLTDARSIVPGLVTAPADCQADARALARLARWLGRYSPWTNTDGEDGVLLDVTGCAGLFGGEADLLTDMGRRLTDFGFRHRLGLADTPGAAWTLARYGAAPVAPAGGTAEALGTLPVEGLRLDLETVTLLKRLGLKRIGQLYAIPRPALARRFHSAERRDAVLHRLDQALGLVDEPLSPLAPVPDYRAGLSLAEPVQEAPGMALVLDRLAGDLCAVLKERGLGAQRLVLDAWRVDGTYARLRLGASRPTHDPRHVKRLFREHLESLDAGFGIDRVVLGAERVAALAPRQSAFNPGTAESAAVNEEALARLIDRLAARFGEDAVTRLQPLDSHIPERAERAVAAIDVPHPPTPAGPKPLRRGEGPEGEERACGRNHSSPLPSGEVSLRSMSEAGRVRGEDNNPPRPFLLFERPEAIAVMAQVPDGPPLRFRWRRVLRVVARAEGPERIAPEWWRPGEETRDYYRVEDSAGRRYWLYREGLYGESGNAPRWYVHGVFG